MRPTASILELRHPQKVPVILSAIAGYIDSCTFLGLFGLFVAQVTGSFVVAGAQLVTHDPGFLIKILGIPFFLLGGITTTIIVTAAIAHGSSAHCWTFGLEGFLLLCFLAIGVTAAPFHSPGGVAEIAAAFFGLSAMGVQSAQVRLLMNGVASTTVMTTNTTLIAIEATQMALAWRRARGSNDDDAAATRFTTARRQLLRLVSIALGFLGGTILGAFAYQIVGFWSLLLPTTAILLLTLWVALTERSARVQPHA
jgi:uncharacterized membrane protein YoaK (UPF0700 family)